MFNPTPRKRFGQHFLKDDRVISAIIQSVSPMPEDKVIEIGPGRGALTLPLLKELNQLIAIELDQDVVREWRRQAHSNLTLIQADALSVDYNQWGKSIRLIGNLPYNISTPLILHFLAALDNIQDMHFMLQKEVVDRLAAEPETKDFGRLTVMVQAYFEVEHLFDVPPIAFDPPPKVQSAVVRLIPLSKRPDVEQALLSGLLRQAFGMRRKTLANNLKGFLPLSVLEVVGIDPKFRPEAVTVRQYLALARHIYCNDQGWSIS